MIIEYDFEDRCIRVNGEYVAIREAEGLKDELELAIDQWEVDHAEQCDNPDGHYDDWIMEEDLIEELKLLGWHEF